MNWSCDPLRPTTNDIFAINLCIDMSEKHLIKRKYAIYKEVLQNVVPITNSFIALFRFCKLDIMETHLFLSGIASCYGLSCLFCLFMAVFHCGATVIKEYIILFIILLMGFENFDHCVPFW